MQFFPFSWVSRRKRAEAKAQKEAEIIATVALAGWRIEWERFCDYSTPRAGQEYEELGRYHLYDPNGVPFGFNNTRAGAARYALALIEKPN